MELEICSPGRRRWAPSETGAPRPLTVRLPGGEAEKPGVCPQLQADLNCTQECLSDAQCADNLKCCQAGCATICHLPNGNPGRPGKGREGRGGLEEAELPDPGRGPPLQGPLQSRDGWNQVLSCFLGPRETKASLKLSGRWRGAGGGSPTPGWIPFPGA